jgi:hypothetical protein
MIPDLIKKGREGAPYRTYDARSHQKRERRGTIADVLIEKEGPGNQRDGMMPVRPQISPIVDFSQSKIPKHIFIIWLSVDSLDLLLDTFDFPSQDKLFFKW